MSDDIELTRLRRRAALMTANRPEFLGSVLARYQTVEGLDADGIAQYLRVTPNRLNNLAICRIPRPDHFAGDLDAISTRFGADTMALARIIRHVSAITVLSGDDPDTWLQAARDADDPNRQGEHDRD
jgi:hypothetical protein